MTTLEIILIAIIWIVYGLFTIYQTDADFEKSWDDAPYTCILIVVLSPLALLIRIIIGIFASKTLE